MITKYKINSKHDIYWNFWIPSVYFTEGVCLYHQSLKTGYFKNSFGLYIKYIDQVNKKPVSELLGVFEYFKIRKHIFSKDKTIYLYNFISSFSKDDVNCLINILNFEQ